MNTRYFVVSAFALSLAACSGGGRSPENRNVGTLTANADSAIAGNATPTTIDVLANDTHTGSITVELGSFAAASTQGGSVALDDNGTPNDASDDKLVYSAPSSSFSGTDTFVYVATDEFGNTSSATVTLNVANSAPPQPAMNCDTTAPGAGQFCFEGQLTSEVDGEIIDFSVFMPDTAAFATAAAACTSAASASDGVGCVPLLIHSHGFGGSKYSDFSNPQTFLDVQIAQKAWDSGYIVITYSQRGFGNSGGIIELMSPEIEGEDFKSLVNWAITHLREDFIFNGTNDVVTAFDTSDACHTAPKPAPSCNTAAWGDSLLMVAANQARVDPNAANIETDAVADPAIGTVGYSYGGGYQFNAQRVDPRLDAIMPMGTWHDLRYALSINDNPKTVWIELLTSFAIQGSQRPLPPFLVDAGVEARAANTKPDDAPHNKSKQVSTTNGNVLAPNGPVSYCQPGQEGIDLRLAGNTPINADLFMIQGYGDTLFNFNEGFNNANCWEQAKAAGRTTAEVYLLQETSGHPAPAVGPNNYAGSDTGMYLDEVVHCGVDNSGKPNRIVMKETGFKWFEAKLRGQPLANFVADWDPDGTAAAHDRVCMTQENTDTNDELMDPAFSGVPSAAPNPQFDPTTHRYSKEGVMLSMPSDIVDAGKYTMFTAPSTQVLAGGAFGVNNEVFIPLKTMGPTETQVLAGIPLVKMELTRANANDQIIFAGIGVRRPASTRVDLLHFQTSPVRVFNTAAAYAAAANPNATTEPYPKNDPRDDDGMKHFIQDSASVTHPMPFRFGDHPQDNQWGRLIGVTARLNPGDQVGLVLQGHHNIYTTNVSTGDPVIVSGPGADPLSLPTPTFPDIEVMLPLYSGIPVPCNHNGSGVGDVTGVGDC